MLLTIYVASNHLRRAGSKLAERKTAKKQSARNGDGDGDGVAAVAAAAGAESMNVGEVVLFVVLTVFLLTVLVLYFIGLCTIFNRANPDLSGGAKFGAYVLLALQLLFLGDIYIMYFVIRMGIQGLRGVDDYKSLPFRAPFFRPKRVASE
jgi:hypothetical protein